MFPVSLDNYFEIATLIISILFWYKIKKTKLQWLLPFLAFIVLVELTGRYMRTELHVSNAWIYNISVPVEYLFYAFLFMIHYHMDKFIKAAKVFLISFTLFVLINIFFIQGIVIFNTNVLKIGSFFMIIFSCLYFVQLFKEEKEIKLLREPIFWIASGVLIFNTGEFLYSLFSDYLFKMHLDKTRSIFSAINNRLIWVLYTCISIAIVCSKKKHQKA